MTTTTEDLEDVSSEEVTRNEIPLEHQQMIFSTDSAVETATSDIPQTETSATEPETPNPSPSSPENGFSLDMLRGKIRELEGRPGGSRKIKGLLRKLKEAVDGPQGSQSTAAVYRVVHQVAIYVLM